MDYFSNFDFTCSVCKCKKNEGAKVDDICIECKYQMNNILTVKKDNLEFIKTEVYVVKGTEDYKYFPVNGNSKERRYNIYTYKYKDINVYGYDDYDNENNYLRVYIYKDKLLKFLFR